MIGSPRFGVPLGEEPRVTGKQGTLNRNQRRRMRLYIRLAVRQGGIRCEDGYLVPCWLCQWWLPMAWATIEHLVNQCDGGTNAQSNLRLVHWRCNQRRNQRDIAIKQLRIILIAAALATGALDVSVRECG